MVSHDYPKNMEPGFLTLLVVVSFVQVKCIKGHPIYLVVKFVLHGPFMGGQRLDNFLTSLAGDEFEIIKVFYQSLNKMCFGLIASVTGSSMGI